MHYDKNIYVLIKSMTALEKRFFRTHTQRISRDSRHILLFDTIDKYLSKHSEVDEKAIKHKLQKAEWIHNFAFVKNYLFTSILESQRAYEGSRQDALDPSAIDGGLSLVISLFGLLPDQVLQSIAAHSFGVRTTSFVAVSLLVQVKRENCVYRIVL